MLTAVRGIASSCIWLGISCEGLQGRKQMGRPASGRMTQLSTLSDADLCDSQCDAMGGFESKTAVMRVVCEYSLCKG